MTTPLVFVPISADDLAQLATGSPLGPMRAFAATDELVGCGPDAQEEAEFLALLLASVAALSAHGQRLVAVAAIEPTGLVDAANGEVLLPGLQPAELRSFFTEESAVDTAQAAAAASGKSIDDAWDEPAVQRLLADADLLWNDASELANLVGGA